MCEGWSETAIGCGYPTDQIREAEQGYRTPHAIASVIVERITPETCNSIHLFYASGSKAGGRGPGSKSIPGAKKIAPSIKKRIVPAIGALAAISSEGTQESSSHDQAPEVQSKAGFAVDPRSFNFDLQRLRRRGLTPKFLFLTPHPLALLELP
jgi:hypothetical protein